MSACETVACGETWEDRETGIRVVIVAIYPPPDESFDYLIAYEDARSLMARTRKLGIDDFLKRFARGVP